MKKLVILICIIGMPFAAASQTQVDVIVENATSIIKTNSFTTTDASNKRNHTYFTAKAEVIKLNHKKSLDLISIKAFRKASQLRSKETIRC
jgi:hypothetical protein